MKAIITTYALTGGIQVEQGYKLVGSDGFYGAGSGQNYGFSRWYHRGDWHATREDAIACVQEMGARKRASLQKQLALLDGKVAKAIAQIEKAEL